jgi:hypothetical protein
LLTGNHLMAAIVGCMKKYSIIRTMRTMIPRFLSMRDCFGVVVTAGVAVNVVGTALRLYTLGGSVDLATSGSGCQTSAYVVLVR